ncbi:MAG: hypothetical protein ACRCZI_11690, partial [Cetobacterium sp.]
KKKVMPLIISWFAWAKSCFMASITISVVGISGEWVSFLTGNGENQSDHLCCIEETNNSVVLTHIGQLGPVFGCNIVEHSIQPLLNHSTNIRHTILLEIGTVNIQMGCQELFHQIRHGTTCVVNKSESSFPQVTFDEAGLPHKCDLVTSEI